jgi:hypothetical protein
MEKLTYEEGQVLFRAEVIGSSVSYLEFVVIKLTPKGAWVISKHYHMAHKANLNMPWLKKRWKWTPLNGKKLSRTHKHALKMLKHRTFSYVNHCRRRLEDAEKRAGILGVDTSLALSLRFTPEDAFI